MYKFLMTCLLLTLHFSAFANKSLVPILTDFEALDVGTIQPVMINDRIIFAGSDSIWSLNTKDLSQETLLNDGLYESQFIRPRFYRLDDQHIYFLENRNSLAALWRTDGTASGTELALDLQLRSAVNTLNGYIYGKDIQGHVVVSDGHSMVRHLVQTSALDSLCIFDLNNIIYPVFGGFGHSKDGVDADVGITYWGGLNYRNERLAQHNNACFVPVTQVVAGTGIRNFWKIDSNGNTAQLNHVLPPDYFLRDLVSFKGGLYGTGLYEGNVLSDMIKFDQNVTQIDHRVEMAYPEDFGHMIIIGDHIASIKSNTVTGFSERTARFYDQNLSPVTERFYRKAFATDTPSDYLPPAHQSSIERMVKIDNYNTSVTRDSTLYFAPLNNPNNQVTLPENSYNQVISDPESGDFYVLSTSDFETTKTLYRVVESPSISHLVSGSWFDPNIRNQGFVIRKGIRQDGREYIMVTGFTFRQGEPFWVAGMAELDPPQQSISMTLSEFNGIGLFESGATPNQAPFGELTISMAACDQMQAVIHTLDDAVIDLSLSRIDDVTFTQNCVD